ncbi:MAG: hypothetical protein EKK55_17255 [Rhodocyclaceae bacterium]|nr:MAG: hypothetical protein EKK55_17255 [Rhodocyclaceae bacterium]
MEPDQDLIEVRLTIKQIESIISALDGIRPSTYTPALVLQSFDNFRTVAKLKAILEKSEGRAK